MSEEELTLLRTQVQQLTEFAKRTDFELTKLQGHCAAVELVLAALVLINPSLKQVSTAIAQNKPQLSDSIRDQMFAITLQRMEQAMTHELQRREAVAAKQ